MRTLLLLLLLTRLAVAQEALTAEQAVQMAMRQNPAVQVLQRQLEVVRGESEQAGLLVNPSFSITVGSEHTEYGIGWNLLDLWRRSDRAELADLRLSLAELELADEWLELALQVKTSFYQVQGLVQACQQLELVLQAAEAASELHRRQFRAGNLPELALAQQEAAELEARIELNQTRRELEQDSLELNLILGQQPDSPLELAVLPEPPEREVALEGLEALAMERRPDLAMARLEIQADRQSVALASGGLLDEVSFGYSKDPEIAGPSLSVPVPLFDRRQGEVASLRAKTEQSLQRLAFQERKVATEVRRAHNRLLARRQKVEQLSDMIVQRRRILHLARPYYDSMLLGIYPLLEFRQEVARTRRELIEATRDYWVARAELERALGGLIP